MIRLIATGLLAGIVAGILYVAAGSGSFVSLALFYVAPLPLAIAGFVWRWPASIAAALAGAAAVMFAADVRLSVIFLITFAVPVGWFCRRALLFREVEGPTGKPEREWYPLGNIVAALAALASVLVIAGIYALAGGFENYEQFVRESFAGLADLARSQGQNFDVDPEAYREFTGQMVYLLPVMLSSGWIMIMLVNLYGGAKIAKLSNQLERPWEDLTRISLPNAAVLAFPFALAGTFLGGAIGLAALVVAGSLAVAHAVIGLCVIHALTNKLAARPVILTAIYGAIILLGFPALFVAGIGLVEPWARLREKALNQPPPGPPANT